MKFHVEALCEHHFSQLHDLFDAVCREKRFLAFTQAGPKEETFLYYRRILETKQTHYVAVREQEILGWCDVIDQFADTRKHVGTLGMAVRADARGKGIGRALIQASIEGATRRALTRIELTVHSENLVAQKLYQSVGFLFEGTQRNSWRIDGKYYDIHTMARLNES